MIHFKLLVFFCFGLYLAECFLWTGADGWLFLAWWKNFSAVKGPGIRFRNPWPSGFVHRFRLSDERPSAPARLTLAEAQSRWDQFLAAAKFTRWFGRVLLLTAVSAFLLYAFRGGSALAWGVLFFFFLLSHLSIVQIFWRNYPKLYPGRKFDWIKGTLLCLLSPWQSARALDLLGDPLLEGFHPLVAAKLFLKEEAFAQFARRWMLELRYGDLLHPEENGRRLYLGSKAGEEDQKLSAWLTGLGLDLSQLLKPLEPSHPSHLSYCRRCDVEYGIPAGKCGDCGRDLSPFKG